MWIAPEKSAVSLAQWNERVVLIGARRSLQEAIDRSQAESRTYCPLLISAAKQSKLQDVWVVGSEDADTVAVNFALIAERIEQDKLSAPPGATALPIRLVSAIPVSAEEAREERPKVEPAKSPEIAKAEAPKPVEAKTVDAKPEPRVIRIYGLDGGTREIVLPPKEPQSN